MKTEIDPVFAISDKLREWADREVPSVDIDRETGRFVDHWLANGERKKSWEATWRNWMRRSPSMGGYLKSQGPRQVEEVSDETRKSDADKAVAQMAEYRNR